MDLCVCVAVAFCLHVAAAVHRDPADYGNYGTTDSGPFWGPPVTMKTVPKPPTTPTPIQRNFRPQMSYGASRPRPSFVRRPLVARYHRDPGQSPFWRPRPSLTYRSHRVTSRGHRKVYIPPRSQSVRKPSTTPPPEVRRTNLFEIFRGRQSAIQNEQQRQMIMHYLLELYKMRALLGQDSETSLDTQIEFIEGIRNNMIKREVLKIFVKDMVERSGFLQGNATVQDLQAISSLVDRINMIMSEMTFANQLAEIASNPDDFVDQMFPALASLEQARTANALASFNNLARMPQTWPSKPSPSTAGRGKFVSRPGDASRSVQSSLVGMSIYGDRPRVQKRETTTVSPSTPATKRGKTACAPPP